MCLTDFLGKQLDDYVATLPVPTFIERMGTRSGLIRARLRGSVIHFTYNIKFLVANSNLASIVVLICKELHIIVSLSLFPHSDTCRVLCSRVVDWN